MEVVQHAPVEGSAGRGYAGQIQTFFAVPAVSKDEAKQPLKISSIFSDAKLTRVWKNCFRFASGSVWRKAKKM